MKEEQDGAKDSSLRHASIGIYELCGYSINHNPCFLWLKKWRIQLITQGFIHVALSLSERM